MQRLLVGMLLALSPAWAMACSCTKVKDGLQGVIDRARVVAVVRVVSAEVVAAPNPTPWRKTMVVAKFAAVRSLKGDVASVSHLEASNGSCGLPVTLGHDYLVFVSGSDRVGSLEYCDNGRHLGEGWDGRKDSQLDAIARYAKAATPIPNADDWLRVRPPPSPSSSSGCE
ncbi:hypothetical protein [Lysobacter sp. ESA13C]|uniref:hypothetical protein n=1 Tax=Lysobacter sp. ESA13C TaxID=2862676 RepID=UPI001CBECA0D|nr:hypothetical protein [Lysobacter sp. ESA13C]